MRTEGETEISLRKSFTTFQKKIPKKIVWANMYAEARGEFILSA